MANVFCTYLAVGRHEVKRFGRVIVDRLSYTNRDICIVTSGFASELWD